MIEIPASFRAMPRWWIDGSEWLDRLPDLVERQCRTWGLSVDGAPAHGSNALVLPVRRGDTPLALRLAPVEDVADDVAPLRFWAGRGTVLLIKEDREAGALLLERLDPRRTLMTEPLDSAAHQLGLIMGELAVPADPSIRFTGDMITDRLAELHGQWAELGRPATRAVLDRALEAGATLIGVDGSRAANGDLHHDQVLAGTRAPWLCVDARLLRGDRAYDLARCLWTRIDEMPDAQTINDQLAIIADAAEIDHDHARRSALFRTLDYWLWGLAHGLTEDPIRCARLTEALS